MPVSTLKIIIADDDEPICNLLSGILSTFEGVAVVGKTNAGSNLLELVTRVWRKNFPSISVARL